MAENDFNEIFQNLLEAADKGDPKDIFNAIDFMASFGLICEDTPSEILEKYNHYVDELVRKEDFVDLICLASSFTCSDLDDEDKNPEEALRLYKLAAENGIGYGYECIGMMYYSGKYLPQDFEKAYKYFTKIDEHKAFSTLYALGEMHRLGIYLEKDLKKACDYYSQITSEEGNGCEFDIYYWRAFYRLACAKHRGEGTEKDLDEALRLIKKAQKLYKDESDPIRPEERITKKLINKELADIQSELNGDTDERYSDNTYHNKYSTVRMHVEACEDKDRELEHFEGLGNIWAMLVNDEDDLENEVPMLIQKAFEEGEPYKSLGDSVKYVSYPKDSSFRFIVSLVEADDSYQVASFGPLPVGVVSELKVEGVYEWESKLEGEVQTIAPFDNHNQVITFFDPLFIYNKAKYQKNKNLEISLSAVGFYCEKNEPETYIIEEGEMYESYIEQFLEENPDKTGEDAPPLEVSNEGMTMFYQEKYACEYQYRGIVLDVEELEFNNKAIKKLTLIVIRGEEPQNVVAINMYIPADRIQENYEPERGDEVIGTLMLIGTVKEKGDDAERINYE